MEAAGLAEAEMGAKGSAAAAMEVTGLVAEVMEAVAMVAAVKAADSAVGWAQRCSLLGPSHRSSMFQRGTSCSWCR